MLVTSLYSQSIDFTQIGSKMGIPILEYDNCKSAVIEPNYLISNHNIPTNAVACFFEEVIQEKKAAGYLKRITEQRSEMGYHPIYEMEYRGEKITVFHPGQGAPLSVAFLEEVIAYGVRNIIVCGGSGALYSDIKLGTLIVPESGIRDEGTSYHYLPPSIESFPGESARNSILSLLKEKNLKYLEGKTWTTDAVYRETKKKINQRKSQGCIVVDMEASAMFAVSKFRNINLACIFYAGDCIDQGRYQHRSWNKQKSIRDQLFEIACQACINIEY